MTKLELQSIIEKYHLDGLVENVKWVINKDKTLSIDFMSPTKEMIGNVSIPHFPLPESQIGINNTSQLDKLLSITDGDLYLDYTKEQKVITKLLISDKQFNLNYALADTLTVPKAGKYNGPEVYDLEIELLPEHITALIKAKNALSNSENVLIYALSSLGGGYQLDFIFGGDIEYSNKITYVIKDFLVSPGLEFKLTYNSELLKSILACNKGAESSKLYMSSQGIMKLTFNHELGLNSTYYVVSKSQ
jgi:hypothetical protein